jgi:hypothetical protein
MILKNPRSLPESIVRAVTGDPERRPEFGRLGVTDLIGPAYARYLKVHHWDELETEVENMAWMMLGQAFHHWMHIHAPEGTISEEKIEIPFENFTLSGIPDIVDGDTLYDYKVTSAWSFVYGDKPEWEAQLNVYRWMIWKVKSILVDKLSIVAIIKDFSARKADKESDYPQAPIILTPVKVWDLDKTEDYINERLKAHWQVHSCTPEERWRRADTWAVMKKGRKAALRVLDSEDDAKKWMEANGNKESYIERRIGEDVRCGKYCAVAGVCEIKRERDGGGDVISGQAED